MAKYTFQQTGEQHGWLSVSDDNGNFLAKSERWSIVDEDSLRRLASHICIQGQMIPLGDPRLYTHCQWCGEQVDTNNAVYRAGQYHRECYRNLFMPCIECGRKNMTVYERVHPYQFFRGSGVSQDEQGPQLCDDCFKKAKK